MIGLQLLHRAAQRPHRSKVTVEPAYHPEFGYLCPSVAVRRRVRVAMISAGIGMLIGASVVLSMMDRQFAAKRRIEQLLEAGRTDQAWTANAQAADPANQAALVANQTSASMPSAWRKCREEGDFPLNQECRLIKKRKVHASRTIATRLATIEIGRIRSSVEVGRPASAGMSAKSTQADGGSSGSAEVSPAPSTVASARAAAPAVKSAENGRMRRKSRHPKDDGLKAYAYATPSAQYYHQGETYRGERAAFKGRWGWSW
jgi:hypothetical protein